MTKRRTCGNPETDRSHDDGPPKTGTISGPRRAIVVALIAAQVLVPTVALGLRVQDPARGQVPFGWQMHTTCWGSDIATCD